MKTGLISDSEFQNWSNLKGCVYMILTAFSWAFIGIFTWLAQNRHSYLTGMDTDFTRTLVCLPFYTYEIYRHQINPFIANAYEKKLIWYWFLTSGIGFVCMYYGFVNAPTYLVTLLFNLNPIFSALFERFVFNDKKKHLENKLLLPSFICIAVISIFKNKKSNPNYPNIELGILFAILAAAFTGS